jgi:hypothetical protein
MGVSEYNKCDLFSNEEDVKRKKFDHVIVDASNIIFKNGGCPAKDLPKPKEISRINYIKSPGVLNSEFLETYEKDPRKDKEKDDLSGDEDIESNDELEVANRHIKVRNSIILEFLELARQVVDVGAVIILVWDGTLIGYDRAANKQERPTTAGMNYPIRRIDSVYIMYMLKQLGIPTVCEDYEGEKLACVLAKQLPRSFVYSTDTDVSIFGCVKIAKTGRYRSSKYLSVAHPLEIPEYCRINIAKLLGNDYSTRIYGNGVKKVCDKYSNFMDNEFSRKQFRKACLAYIEGMNNNSYLIPEIVKLLPMLKVAHSKSLFKSKAKDIYGDIENYLSCASPLIKPGMLSDYDGEIALDFKQFNRRAYNTVANSKSKHANTVEKSQFKAADKFFTITDEDMSVGRKFIDNIDLTKKDFFVDIGEVVEETPISSKVREYNRSLSLNCKNTTLETITFITSKAEFESLCETIAKEYDTSIEEIEAKIHELHAKDPELIKEEYNNIDITDFNLKLIGIYYTQSNSVEPVKVERKTYTFKYAPSDEELTESNVVYDFGTINKKICTKKSPYIDYTITKNMVDGELHITIEYNSNIDDLLGTYWSPTHEIGRTNVYLIESVATDDSKSFNIVMASDNNRYQDSAIDQI